MNRKGLTLIECLILMALFMLLVMVLLPTAGPSQRRSRVTACANNLAQLWKMQNVYMSQYGGRMKAMPLETGGGFWLKLRDPKINLIDPAMAEIFLCPVHGEEGTLDYLGPRIHVGELNDGDWVGADRPGNHPDGGNVLRKSGDVTELPQEDFLRAAGRCTP